MLQSSILDKIGGSPKVREELTQALAQGRSVTATVRWISKPGDRGRNRWIAFTPLVGSHQDIGVWVAILIDDELEGEQSSRQAPPMKFRANTAKRIPAQKKPAPSPLEQSSFPPNIERVPRTSREEPVAMPDRPTSSRKEPPQPLEAPPSMPRSLPSTSTITDRSVASLLPEIDSTYESLEVRLRKKRERDAARLLEQAGAPVKPTYKSLSPYAFMNNNGP